MKASRSTAKGLLATLKQAVGVAPRFAGSADYWEQRYRNGGNSGAGSYDRLAVFKAEILNDFVAHNDIASVVEFGVGDGAQLALADYPAYTGIDISETVVAATRKKFAEVPSIRILHTSEVEDTCRADLALSLDVIYHLVEDESYHAYMSQLFAAAAKYVMIYSSNVDSNWSDAHVRHRRFTTWVAANQPDFRCIRRIENKYPYSDKDPRRTSFADFYVFERMSMTGPTVTGPERARDCC